MKTIILLSVLLLNACGTIYTHFSSEKRITVYGGTQYSVEQTVRSWRKPHIPGEVCVWAPDILFSFALDTVLLPLDAIIVANRAESP